MRLHTKLSPSECIERLRNPGAPVPALQRVMANPRYQLDDGSPMFRTRVNGAGFVVDLMANHLRTGRYATARVRPFRGEEMVGRISSDLVGGCVVTVRRSAYSWLGIAVAVVICTLMASFPFIAAPKEHFAQAVLMFGTFGLIMGVLFVVAGLSAWGAMVRFLCDLLEAEKITQERKGV